MYGVLINWDKIVFFHNVISFFPVGKKHFWTKPIIKVLTTSLKSVYYQKCSNECDTNDISTINIVLDGDRDQRRFGSVYKFILRHTNVVTIDSYVIKNSRVYCEKDTYDVLNYSIFKTLNDEMKIIMNEDMFVYFFVE